MESSNFEFATIWVHTTPLDWLLQEWQEVCPDKNLKLETLLKIQPVLLRVAPYFINENAFWPGTELELELPYTDFWSIHFQNS